ncbi:MAG TPA: tripartite tricarboxylate transporter TctB family protein [Burkholderiales bacterium]|nr:tripartite tricarboxylate transporter TctB family protein [Burkholderiales bacterium]
MADRIILACTVLLAVVYLYATTLIPSLEIGDPLGPKAFPRLIGVALLIAAGMLGLEMWRERGKDAAQGGGAALFDPRVVKVITVVVIWVGIYYATLEVLGYIIATTAFLFPLMAWFNRGKWLANALSAVAFAALTYWLFVALDVRLPRGLLPF